MEAGAPMKRLRPALWFCAAMLWTFCSRGEAGPRTFPNTGYGFKLVLTEDWDRLPPAPVKALNEKIARVRPEWPRPALQGGYWMTNAEGYNFHPYIIVRVVETGSTADEKAIRAEWNDKALLPEGAELSDAVLDQSLNAFVANGRAMFENNTPAAMKVAVFPTRLGAIKLFCYAAQTDVENHPDLFAQMLKGVRIAEDNTAGWKPSKTGLWIGLAAIGLVVLTLWRAKPASASSS